MGSPERPMHASKPSFRTSAFVRLQVLKVFAPWIVVVVKQDWRREAAPQPVSICSESALEFGVAL